MTCFTFLITIFAVYVTFTSTLYANPESDQRIDGIPANPGEFPHSVYFKYENETSPYCGGAIIGSKHILTNVYCITRKNGSFEVIVGCVEHDSPYCQPYQVQETIIHPDYNGTYSNNIGVVVLSHNIDFSIFAQIIPLSSKHIQEDTLMNITGMDRYDPNMNMKWLSVKSVNDSDCKTQWPDADMSQTFCTVPGTFVVPGVYGFPVEFSGHLVGTAIFAGVDDLILRVEPYISFLLDIIQGNKYRKM